MQRDKPLICVQPRSLIHQGPSAGAEKLSELLFGETFMVEAEAGDYVLGRPADDDMKGYVAADALAPQLVAPSHRVVRKWIAVYSTPVLNAAVHMQLPLNALIRLSGKRDTICYASGRPGTEAVELASGGWVAMQALAPVERPSSVVDEVAALLIGAPYVPGGRTWLGCDAAGFIHAVLTACGVTIPRLLHSQLVYLERLGNVAAVPPSGACLIYAGQSGGFLLPDGEILVASAASMQIVRGSLADFTNRNGARFSKLPMA